MSVKDFPPRSGHPVDDPDTLAKWLDVVGRRQNINDQLTVSSVSSADSTYLFSVSASKTYQVTLANIVALAAAFTAATQAQMESASSNTVGVTPLSANWHPGVAKVWCYADTAGNINASWNMTSVTDTGAGQITFNIGTDFSSSNWAASLTLYDSGGGRFSQIGNIAAGTALGQAVNFVSGLFQDPSQGYFFQGFGDQ